MTFDEGLFVQLKGKGLPITRPGELGVVLCRMGAEFEFSSCRARKPSQTMRSGCFWQLRIGFLADILLAIVERAAVRSAACWPISRSADFRQRKWTPSNSLGPGRLVGDAPLA